MDACRALTLDDIPRMVEINEQGLPGTGKVSEEEMADLLQLSELALGLEDESGLVGFVLCLLPGTRVREPQLCMVQSTLRPVPVC